MKQINLISQKTTYKLTGPGIDPNKYGTPVGTFEKLVSNIIGILTLVAVLWFALQIIFAGLGMIGAQGDEKKARRKSFQINQWRFRIIYCGHCNGPYRSLIQIIGTKQPLRP